MKEKSSTLRGMFHIHSTYSHDGKISLSNLATLCRENKYDFIITTEHAESIGNQQSMDKYLSECEKLSDSNFLIIPGLEFICEREFHIIGVGVTDYITANDEKEVISEIHAQGSIAVLAHIGYYDHMDYELFDEVDGIEFWNLKYDNKYLPRLKPLQMFEKFRKRNTEVLGFAGLDLHSEYYFGRLSINVEAKNLSINEILSNLKKGNFYFTNRFITLYPTKIPGIHLKVIFRSFNLVYDMGKNIRDFL